VRFDAWAEPPDRIAARIIDWLADWQQRPAAAPEIAT
jgi:hypothetical protein